MELDWKFYVFSVTPNASAGPFAGGRRLVQVYAPFPETVRWSLGAHEDEEVEELPPSAIDYKIGPYTFPRSANMAELVDFYNGLVRCFDMAVPPARALDLLIGGVRTPYFRGVLSGVKHRLNGGESFSEALKLFPGVFNTEIIALVEAGEKAGDLKKVFHQIAESIGRNSRLLKKLTQALIYPSLMMLLVTGAMFVLSWKVFPGLESSLKMLGADLPPMTQVIFGMATFIRKFPYVVLLLPGSMYYLWTRWTLLMQVEWFETLVMKLPSFGSAFRGLVLVRSLRTLCMLIEAGVSVKAAYSVVERSCNDKIYAAYFRAISLRLEAGESEASAYMKERSRIPGREGYYIAQYVEMGAFTGNVVVNLMRYARQLDDDVNLLSENLPKLLEPIMTVIITAFVGVIAISVYKPYFDILLRLTHAPA